MEERRARIWIMTFGPREMGWLPVRVAEGERRVVKVVSIYGS